MLLKSSKVILFQRSWWCITAHHRHPIGQPDKRGNNCRRRKIYILIRMSDPSTPQQLSPERKLLFEIDFDDSPILALPLRTPTLPFPSSKLKMLFYFQQRRTFSSASSLTNQSERRKTNNTHSETWHDDDGHWKEDLLHPQSFHHHPVSSYSRVTHRVEMKRRRAGHVMKWSRGFEYRSSIWRQIVVGWEVSRAIAWASIAQ